MLPALCPSISKQGSNHSSHPSNTPAHCTFLHTGKSTILKLLTRLYDVSSGAVELNGVDIKDLKVEVRQAKGGLYPTLHAIPPPSFSNPGVLLTSVFNCPCIKGVMPAAHAHAHGPLCATSEPVPHNRPLPSVAAAYSAVPAQISGCRPPRHRPLQ